MINYQYNQGAAIAITVISVVSFLSLLFVVIVYLIRWKKIASFPMRLSFYLCISCMIQNLYVVIYPPVQVFKDQTVAGDQLPAFCTFQAILKTSFDLSSIVWTLIILYSSYATVVRGFTLERLELFYLGVGYLAPILVALIPIFFNQYNYDTYFCWLDNNDPSVKFGLKMAYFFGPLWLFFCLQMYWAYRTYRKLKQVGLQGRELNIFKKILMFPIILLITGFFATADLIYQYSTGNMLQWLDVLSIILLSTYGLFISLAYGFNPIIRDQIFFFFNLKDESSGRPPSVTTTSNESKTDRLVELINS